MVFLDQTIAGVDTTSVTSDHFQSSFDICEYLFGLGHRYIGFIKDTGFGITAVDERYKGYEQALFQKKISLRSELVLTIDGSKNIIEQAGKFLTGYNPMSAVIVSCKNSNMPYIFEAVKRYKIKVPSDMSIIVYDNEWEPYKSFLPFVPHYIDQCPQLLGRAAAQMVIDLINKRPLTSRVNIVRSKLREGGSISKIQS